MSAMSDENTRSRADTVRARREKRQRKERTGGFRLRRRPKAEPADSMHSAPVLMRGGKLDVPVQPRKPAKMRRRYDISLGSQGAEVRLPPVPFVRPSWRWLSGLVTAALLALVGLMWSYPEFIVQAIEVQGLQRLEVREVHLVLGIQGDSIFSLDPDVLAYDLGLAFPEFSEVQVHVSLPNSVVVQVHERVPALGWSNSQGLVLVDAEGISFPARGVVNGEGQPFPVVRAPDLVMKPADESEEDGEALVMNPYVNRRLLEPVQVAALIRMAEEAPPNSQIIFNPRHGMGWRDPAGWVVFFGHDGADMDAKVQMYRAIVADLQSRNLTPEYISVEFLHAPYYRMER